ncbi:AAA family ATPase [Neoroseomonas oryzicola]|uniref:AAA family ATPase n=1 Tax=Neoroseomonas oryzicola TaxID=535904 RepID=A0A9X9WLI3_9PROT|nr:AAA family ATPase [Neoroseomonas oryzicola]MBR0661193.1 AAA family ATPase [Neoroseomonas oryzicola]NKE17558.1 AAA family ATPase [Neoroseomonas oryzicola]
MSSDQDEPRPDPAAAAEARRDARSNECLRSEAAWTERNRAAGVLFGVLAPSAAFAAACAALEAFRTSPPGDEDLPNDMSDKQAEAAWRRCAARTAEHADLAGRALEAAGFMVVRSNCGRAVFFLGRLQDADRARGDVVDEWLDDLGGFKPAAGRLSDGDEDRLTRRGLMDRTGEAAAPDAILRALAGASRFVALAPVDLIDSARLCGSVFNFPPELAVDPARPFEALCGLAPEVMSVERLDAHRQSVWGADRQRVVRDGDGRIWPWTERRTPRNGASLLALVARLEQTKRIAAPRPEDRTRFVVEGILPMAAVSLITGPAGSGKSTLALQLLAEVANGGGATMGREIGADFRGRGVVYLSGEDNEAAVSGRLARLFDAGLAADFVHVVHKAPGMSLGKALDEARSLPNVAVVIVDPAGVWMEEYGTANEDKPVNAFLERLRLFAEETGAAVVVIHHPAKRLGSRQPKHEPPRGSQAWIDRVRLSISFVRKAGGAALTIEKSNLDAAPVGRVLALDYDPATGLYRAALAGAAAAVPDVQGGAATSPATDADAEVVIAGVARLTEAGHKVTRTGKASLFERHQHKPANVPEVEGWSRSRCAEAVEAALTAGRIVADPKAGLRAA